MVKTLTHPLLLPGNPLVTLLLLVQLLVQLQIAGFRDPVLLLQRVYLVALLLQEE